MNDLRSEIYADLEKEVHGILEKYEKKELSKELLELPFTQVVKRKLEHRIRNDIRQVEEMLKMYCEEYFKNIHLYRDVKFNGSFAFPDNVPNRLSLERVKARLELHETELKIHKSNVYSALYRIHSICDMIAIPYPITDVLFPHVFQV